MGQTQSFLTYFSEQVFDFFFFSPVVQNTKKSDMAESRDLSQRNLEVASNKILLNGDNQGSIRVQLEVTLFSCSPDLHSTQPLGE